MHTVQTVFCAVSCASAATAVMLVAMGWLLDLWEVAMSSCKNSRQAAGDTVLSDLVLGFADDPGRSNRLYGPGYLAFLLRTRVAQE
jgi:hypothetical protein